MVESVVGQCPWNTDFPPKALHGCPTAEIQCEITGNYYGGKIMHKSYIVP
jgi:hypothetical protein